MAVASDNQFPKVIIRESANDGSDFSNPAADYRVLFLGEDGLLHVKDSSGTVTSPYSSGSAGAMVLLQSQTASTSATLDFTSFLDAAYDEYLFEGFNLRPATDQADLYCRMGTAGPSYDSGTNYYGAMRLGTGTVSVSGATGTPQSGSSNGTKTQADAGSTAIMVAKDISNASADYGHASFSLRLVRPQSTAVMKHVYGQSVWHDGAEVFSAIVGYLWASTSAVVAVRFLMSSGNITSGLIRAYGIKNS